MTPLIAAYEADKHSKAHLHKAAAHSFLPAKQSKIHC